MKTVARITLLAALVAGPISLFAQKDEKIPLLCPFENGSGRAPKEAFSWDPPDHKVVMISQRDSVIRAVVPGEITNVQSNGEDKYEVVIFYKDHYFWYNNVEKPKVTRMQKVTLGQTIGTYKFGVELELRVYKEPRKNDPEMIDPRDWLDCKIPKD